MRKIPLYKTCGTYSSIEATVATSMGLVLMIRDGLCRRVVARTAGLQACSVTALYLGSLAMTKGLHKSTVRVLELGPRKVSRSVGKNGKIWHRTGRGKGGGV